MDAMKVPTWKEHEDQELEIRIKDGLWKKWLIVEITVMRNETGHNW